MKKGRLGTHHDLADDANVVTLEEFYARPAPSASASTSRAPPCLTALTPPSHLLRRHPIKLGTRNNETYNAAPEFEDCRAAAAQHNVPLKLVQQAAIAAYHSSKSK
jgi:hypothetical protein